MHLNKFPLIHPSLCEPVPVPQTGLWGAGAAALLTAAPAGLAVDQTLPVVSQAEPAGCGDTLLLRVPPTVFIASVTVSVLALCMMCTCSPEARPRSTAKGFPANSNL